MTAHSISILSELKTSYFGLTQAPRRALKQLRYQLHSVEGRAKCPTVPHNVVNSWLVHALMDKAVN